jgi:LEA14-like dessication related protein
VSVLTEDKASELESIRKNIVEQHEEEVTPKEMGEALLATAFMLGFFGSAAVLMPSGASPTGMFSGSLTVDAPVVEDSTIRSVGLEGDRLSFIHDSEVYNPNVVEAELQKITYEIIIDGKTVARGVQEGTTFIPAKDDRMVAVEHVLDLSGVSNGGSILTDVASGRDSVKVEGFMQFRSGGETVVETYSREFRLDFS